MCVYNIGRRTQFCDPLKKKNVMISQEGICVKGQNNKIQDMYDNNSNNLEVTFVKFSEKDPIFHYGIY